MQITVSDGTAPFVGWHELPVDFYPVDVVDRVAPGVEECGHEDHAVWRPRKLGNQGVHFRREVAPQGAVTPRGDDDLDPVVLRGSAKVAAHVMRQGFRIRAELCAAPGGPQASRRGSSAPPCMIIAIRPSRAPRQARLNRGKGSID